MTMPHREYDPSEKIVPAPPGGRGRPRGPRARFLIGDIVRINVFGRQIRVEEMAQWEGTVVNIEGGRALVQWPDKKEGGEWFARIWNERMDHLELVAR